MTADRETRRLTTEEAAVIRAVLMQSATPGCDVLIADLDDAVVSNSAQWILDIETGGGRRVELPDGPLPGRAYVPSRAAYQGEIILWVTNGHLSGLEYAWVTDRPPTRWPRPDEMEVVPAQ